MDSKNHAKQFMPFDSLKGFRDELEKKEIKKEERKILTDSSLETLDTKFKRLIIGNEVKLNYYNGNKYVFISGIVKKIDYINKQIIINNDIKINAYNIIDIST